MGAVLLEFSVSSRISVIPARGARSSGAVVFT